MNIIQSKLISIELQTLRVSHLQIFDLQIQNFVKMSGYMAIVNEDVEVQKSDKDSKPSRMIIQKILGFATFAFGLAATIIAFILLLIFGSYMAPEANYRLRAKVNSYKSPYFDGLYVIEKMQWDEKFENDYQLFLDIMEIISKNEEECKIEGNVVRYIRDAFHVSESCYNTMVNKNYISSHCTHEMCLYLKI